MSNRQPKLRVNNYVIFNSLLDTTSSSERIALSIYTFRGKYGVTFVEIRAHSALRNTICIAVCNWLEDMASNHEIIISRLRLICHIACF